VRALLATSFAGLMATLVAGVLPALVGTRVVPGRLLNTASRTGTESPRARRLSRTLLVSQVAICCTLLLGATVLVRSFARLSAADRGIDVRNVMVAWVALTDPAYASPDARRAVTRELADLTLALPGVSQVAWSYGHPPLGAIGYDGNWIPDGPGAEPRHVTASRSDVDGGYFALYGIPMVRGRTFQPSDGQDAAVLSERLATAIFGSTDAVGRYVTFDGQPFREVIRVVGVARDTRLPSLEASQDEPQFYRPFDSATFTPMLSLKCQGTCPDEGILRRQLSAVPLALVQSVRLPERYYLRELARPRAAAALAFGFAVTALVAAGAGLFSLLSYAVTRRRREFGIRAALGASAASLRGLVWRDAFMVLVVGVGLGLVGGASLARVMTSLLYGVTLADPINWAIVIGTIVLAVAAASWRPARTAVRADPLLLLREE
jgi:putative ABC transport system permease protein